MALHIDGDKTPPPPYRMMPIEEIPPHPLLPISEVRPESTPHQSVHTMSRDDMGTTNSPPASEVSTGELLKALKEQLARKPYRTYIILVLLLLFLIITYYFIIIMCFISRGRFEDAMEVIGMLSPALMEVLKQRYGNQPTPTPSPPQPTPSDTFRIQPL